MEATLRLEFSAQVDRPTTCWYVASENARDWIEAALHGFSPGNQSAIQILPVPKSTNHRDPVGAILVGPAIAANICPQKCIRYTHLTDQLIVPLQSRLTPEIEVLELKELLSSRRQHVWHPQSGLIAFESEDILSLGDLIKHRPAVQEDFRSGSPGSRMPRRLTSIYPSTPPTMEIVLDQGQDGIGTKGRANENIPPSEGEPKPGVGNALGRAGLSIFSAGLNMASAAGEFVGRHLKPASSSASGQQASGAADGGNTNWLDQLKDWTRQRLAHLNEAVLSEREKEINRLLMKMMLSIPMMTIGEKIGKGQQANRQVRK